MKSITLKNGAVEAEPLVDMVMLTLSDLIRHRPIEFYELVMCCRDNEHVPFGNTGDKLKEWALYPISDSIRNVVLSAVTGDGIDMSLGSPI